MSNDLVVKHNKIIESKYNMTTSEIKIIAKLTSMIKKDDEDFKEYVFVSKKLLDELNLGKENYTVLEESINKLISRRIEIEQENKKKKLVTTFLSSCMYDNTGDESKVILRYDPQLKPYFLQLGKHFTKYYLQNVLELNSFYAIRIYELCKQYETLKERIILVEKLKEILDIEEKYKKYNDFKKYVLEIAKREINEKTDINIDYEEMKTGRKVTKIKFLVSSKKNSKKIKKEIENIEEVKEYPEEVLELFNILPFSEQVEKRKAELAELLKSHTFEYLKSDIEYCNEQRPEKYWSYFVKSVNSGHFSAVELEKAEKIKEQKKEKEQREIKENERQEMEKEQINELAEQLYNSLTEEMMEEYTEKSGYRKLPEKFRKNFNLKNMIIVLIKQEIEVGVPPTFPTKPTLRT